MEQARARIPDSFISERVMKYAIQDQITGSWMWNSPAKGWILTSFLSLATKFDTKAAATGVILRELFNTKTRLVVKQVEK